MLIDEAAVSKRFIDLLKADGIFELYPPQESALNSRAMQGRNLVLATPTASGKTLAAEILMARILEEGKKAVYVVPLRALAYEKFIEFRKYESLGYSVRLEMGDLDSSKYRRRSDFDILVTTAEKCDSILRSRREWFENIGILVMDEIHLINSDRGPVYEVLISKFRKLSPEMQILALSATIGNAEELADWLDAELIESEWRPVKLTERVEVGQKHEKLKELMQESLKGKGQTLIFVNSRRSAESVAEKLGQELNLINDDESEELKKIKKRILSALSSPTHQCKRLASCVEKGAVFHHAGITNKQRTLVEDAFKEGLLKAIAATPTLAAGVNLPSRTVIVRDLQRYSAAGLNYIPVLEYKQQVGRAGRPKYDREGFAIVIAKTEDEKELLLEKYINGEIEQITSRLGVEPVLRFHVLASIASGFTRNRDSLIEFFKSTFFGYQYGTGVFEKLIDRILKKLEDWNFIQKENEFLIPTELGQRVSELYIDPMTAFNYISLLQVAEQQDLFEEIGLLEMLCDSAELPLSYVKRSEEQDLWQKASLEEDKLLRGLDEFDLDASFLERFKTANILRLWINEVSEDAIFELHKIAPGILHQRMQIAEWLAYSGAELSGILKMRKSSKEMKKLQERLKHGIKEELLKLVRIKGIGRARARKLWNSGIKSPADIKKADKRKLKSILGEKVTDNVLTELNI